MNVPSVMNGGISESGLFPAVERRRSGSQNDEREFSVRERFRLTRLIGAALAGLAGHSETQAQHITQILVVLEELRHNFHYHPRQEEIVYVLDGEIEQMAGDRKRTLKKGDAAFIGPGVVHGSFNITGKAAQLMAVLSPPVRMLDTR